MGSEILIAIGVVCGALTAAAIVPLLRYWRGRRLQTAIRGFRRQREMLEAKFFELASQSGKPRGLRWTECDWQDAVTFATDVRSGLLTAFVSMEVHFEAEEGGDMEGVAAVSTIRDACAVFHWQRGRWGTGGRALFNMNPHEALHRLAGQYRAIGAQTI